MFHEIKKSPGGSAGDIMDGGVMWAAVLTAVSNNINDKTKELLQICTLEKCLPF
jgi:hypothetical protein